VLHRRQLLIPDIAHEYHDLVDAVEGRLHANVTVAEPVDDAARNRIAEQLSAVMGKRVVPHMIVNPDIMGGVVVRMGDTVLDGSVRRRLAILKGRMLGR
jgi:F-type H+-transporting ATPase subunit delta